MNRVSAMAYPLILSSSKVECNICEDRDVYLKIRPLYQPQTHSLNFLKTSENKALQFISTRSVG